MKLPNPSFCGLYSRGTGAYVLTRIQCLSAFYVLAKYIETRVIQMEGMSGVGFLMTLFIFCGLIFNLILQFILFLGILKKDLAVCRVWLFLGILGIIFWNLGVYEMSICGPHSASQSFSDKCVVLGGAGIIYECYFWYVILAFTVSLIPGRKETGVPVPGQVNVNSHHVMEIEQNNGSNGDANDNPLPPPVIPRPPAQRPGPSSQRPGPSSQRPGPSSQRQGLDGRSTTEILRDMEFLEEMELFERRRIAVARTRELEQEYQRLVSMHRERTANDNNLISQLLDLSNNGQANNSSEVRAVTFDPPPNYNDIGVPPPYPGTNA